MIFTLVDNLLFFRYSSLPPFRAGLLWRLVSRLQDKFNSAIPFLLCRIYPSVMLCLVFVLL